MSERVRVAMVGCGGMARHHLRNMLKQTDTTEIAALCEPSPAACEETAKIFAEAGVALPPNEPDLVTLLRDYDLDAAFIITPTRFTTNRPKPVLKQGSMCCWRNRW